MLQTIRTFEGKMEVMFQLVFGIKIKVYIAKEVSGKGNKVEGSLRLYGSETTQKCWTIL
jgi:hypothetical protein